MKTYTFQPGPRCGNCKKFDRNKDKKDQPLPSMKSNRYHTGAYCHKDFNPEECGEAFVSRHGGSRKKKNNKPWHRAND